MEEECIHLEVYTAVITRGAGAPEFPQRSTCLHLSPSSLLQLEYLKGFKSQYLSTEIRLEKS
jgi:hypothetical protein